MKLLSKSWSYCIVTAHHKSIAINYLTEIALGGKEVLIGIITVLSSGSTKVVFLVKC